MLINGQNWNSCDLCGANVTAEYAYVARGATGRYCVVLSACGECIGDNTPMSPADAVAVINERGDGYADFPAEAAA